jgi:branched-chain amino acid transport system permease protein
MEIDWLFLGEVSLAGLGSGALLALTGLAFVLIYKATKVVNLAVGEIVMLGAYLFFGFAAGAALPAWAAILLAVVGGGAVGALLERTLIRPMLGESAISVFMVTVGLGSVLTGLVELIWGADPRQLPAFMPSAPVFIGEAYVSPKIAVSFGVAAIVIALFLAVFRFWRGGVALRATATDQAAAYSCGINVPGVFSLAWTIACATAAGAGVLVGAIGGISPVMGVFGLSVLVVVIVGGLDSVVGALLGGLLVGLVEAWAGAYLGGEYKLLMTFCILVVVLMVRPYGLFGTTEIERL